jgi:HEPN domain-containing protein
MQSFWLDRIFNSESPLWFSQQQPLNSKEELGLLKKRASVFFRQAESLFSEGEYDIAAFNAEQSAQLFCKAALLEVLGDFPKSHSVIDLITRLGDAMSSTAVREFVKENRESLKLLETAYLSSRYILVPFSKEDAEKLISTSRKVKNLVNKFEKSAT